MISRLLLLALLFVFHKEVDLKRPKYILDIERFEACTEPKYSDMESPVTNIKLYRVNETTRAFNFDVQVKRMWGEDVGIGMELDVWAYAGWTPIPYMSLKPDICNTIRSMQPGLMTSIMQNWGAKHPDKCPIEPGSYSLKNYTWNQSTSGNHIPFKGRFRLIAVVASVRTKELIACLVTILSTKENLMV